MTPQEEATLLLSQWQRDRHAITYGEFRKLAVLHPLYKEAVKQCRIRQIEWFRYKQLIEWLSQFEPGKVPYGVKS